MKQRHTILLLCIAVPICAILRTIQLFFTIDSKTGFIKPQYTAISMLISIIVCVSAIVIALLSISANQKSQTRKGFNAVLSIVSVITSLAFLNQTVAETATLEKNRLLGTVLIYLTIAVALAIFVYGIRDLVSYKFPSMIFVVFPVYFIVKLINLFVSTSAIALITQNVFLLFTNCALLLFMHELANFENGVENMSKRPKKLYAYGVAAAILCAATSVPELVMIIAEKAQPSYSVISNAILNIFVGIFVITYILCNFNDNEKIQKPIYKHSA